MMTITADTRRRVFEAASDGTLPGSQLLAFYAAEKMQLVLIPQGVERAESPPHMDKVLDALRDARKAVRNGQAYDFQNIPPGLIDRVQDTACLAYQHDAMRMKNPVFVMAVPRGYLHAKEGPWMAVAADTDGDALPDLAVLVGLQKLSPDNMATVPILAARLRKGSKGSDGPDMSTVSTVAGDFPFGSYELRLTMSVALVRAMLAGLFIVDAAPPGAFTARNYLNVLSDDYKSNNLGVPTPPVLNATRPALVDASTMERAGIVESKHRRKEKVH